MKCFVDTSAWIAYFDRGDQFHPQADRFLRRRPSLITSNIVLHETVALLAARISKRVAQVAGTFLFDQRLVELVTVQGKQELEAWRVYLRQKGRISFVDCTNTVVMSDKGLSAIFAFDDDFRKLHLRVVP